MATDISKLGVKATWEELTEGMIVAGAGTSKEFNTGEWSEVKPEFIADKCNSVYFVYRSVRTAASR